MPGLAFHSQYWQVQAPEVPVVPGASSDGGYIPFQMNIVMGSLFGSLQALYERLVRWYGRA